MPSKKLSYKERKDLLLQRIAHAEEHDFGPMMMAEASVDLRDDKDVILVAIEQNPCIALRLASDRLANDREVVTKALSKMAMLCSMRRIGFATIPKLSCWLFATLSTD